MANWGCHTGLDVFMYIFVIFFAFGALAFLGLFVTCAADNDICTRGETIAGFVLFICMGVFSCLGCVYFCSCSLSKEDLQKRRETEQLKKQPLVIPQRRYQKQNSQFLKNVVYEGPGGKQLVKEDSTDGDDGQIKSPSTRNLLEDQNSQGNMV